MADNILNNPLTGNPAASTRGDGPSYYTGTPGQASQTGAGEELGAMVRQVDFPAFVSSLIEGVFTSIVQSSIQQMEAFSKLVESIAQSTESYADANIPDEEARNKLVQMFPGQLKIEGGVLQTSEDAQPDFKAKLGADAPTDLSDQASEQELVRRARVDMARQKQQLLATMVMLGINRIIVTDGEINAKVTFDVRAQRSRSSQQGRGGLIAAQMAGASSDSVMTAVSTFDESTLREDAESINAKAQLTGSVSLKFKSETFPLERMAGAGVLGAIEARAEPGQATYGGRGGPALRGPRGTPLCPISEVPAQPTPLAQLGRPIQL